MLDNSHWHPGFSAFGAVPNANASDSDSGDEQPEEAIDIEYALSQDNSGGIMPVPASEPNDTESQFETSSESSIPPSPGLVNEEIVSHSQNQISAHYSTPIIALPFNLLGTSEFDITLFFRIVIFTGGSSGQAFHGRVVCKRALQQKIPPGLYQLSRIERLNMVAQISELGIVVIGNQAGRVGILTSTAWQRHVDGGLESVEGFRIVCILPFKSQEERGVRPLKPLMGIAVSPIQGHADPPEPGSAQETSQQGSPRSNRAYRSSRRYRLLIVYCDHTVMSYEISQPENSDILVV